MEWILKSVKHVFTSGIFRRILLLYMILVVVLSAVCGYAYYQALEMSVQHLLSQNQLVFEHSAVSLRSTWKLIETVNNNLYYQNDLQQLMRRSNADDRNAIIDVYKVIQNLPAMDDSSGIISGYFIYLPTLDYIVAPKQGFTNPKRYFDTFFSLSEDQSYEEWREGMLKVRGRKLLASGDSASEIHCITSLSSGIVGVFPGLVVYRINSNRILQQLSASFAENMECALILDMDGAVLASSAGNPELVQALDELELEEEAGTFDYNFVDSRYILSYQTVPEFGMRIMILSPYHTIVLQAKGSIHGMLTILLWLLLIGLAVIVIMILFNYIPLMRIEEHVCVSDSSSRGLWMISEAFQRMEHNRENLEKRMEEQRLHLRNACVNHLIHGNVSDAYDLEEMVERAELPISGSCYCGVLIGLNNIQLNDASRALILELLNQYDDQLLFLTFESLNVVACLHFRGEEEDVDMRGFFTQIYETMNLTCGFETSIYVGTPCGCLEQISDSFASAAWLMSTASHNEWLCIAEPDARAVSLRSIIAPDDEKQLENYVGSGQREEALSLLEGIYRHNFVQNNIRGFSRQFLYCRLVGILAASDAEFDDADELPDQLMQLSGWEFFTWMRERVERCCEQASTKSSQRSQRLIDDVRRYVEENYADYELTLNSLAFRFGITGNYLSGLFKKQLGANFSVYLEQIRIEHAEQMLSGTEMNIDEIALKIGYANSDSFRRAFRRVRGINPTQFRSSVHPTE